MTKNLAAIAPKAYTYDETLMEMLGYGRPHQSLAEKAFLKKFIHSIPGGETDGYGNFVVKIGDKPKIMWSCHTDTVHASGVMGQRLVRNDGYVALQKKRSGRVLGADDTAGVWLMRELIFAKKPGLYVFHRAEELGGLGSRWRATHAKEDVDTVECVIALDRKGYQDIITHQVGGRCCSDAFAKSLAKQLGGGYKPDDSGTFTDSANYIDIVGECTNISVGYAAAHSANESLDVYFLQKLLPILLKLDSERLIYERRPGEKDLGSYNDFYDSWGVQSTQSWANSYYSQSRHHNSKPLSSHHNSKPLSSHHNSKPLPSTPKTFGYEVYDEDEKRFDNGHEALALLVLEYPEEVADLLNDFGVDAAKLRELLRTQGIKID